MISQIHPAYLEAGADILETNTFNGTCISQASLQFQLAGAQETIGTSLSDDGNIGTPSFGG